jgi:hypothetical protein
MVPGARSMKVRRKLRTLSFCAIFSLPPSGFASAHDDVFLLLAIELHNSEGLLELQLLLHPGQQGDILSFGNHELFHLITNTNLKLLEKRRLSVMPVKSVNAHAVDAMAVWHLLSRRSSSCSVCSFCFKTRDSRAFKANGFVCLMACKSALQSPVSFLLLSMKNLSIYLLV